MARQMFPTHAYAYEGLGVFNTGPHDHLPTVPDPPCESRAGRCEHFARCASDNTSCVAFVAYCRGLPSDYIEGLEREPRANLGAELDRGSCKATGSKAEKQAALNAVLRLQTKGESLAL